MGSQDQQAKPQLRPNQDQDANIPESPLLDPVRRHEERGVQKGIADADKKARAEAEALEPVRNTPPAGEWNETAPNERVKNTRSTEQR